MIPKIEQHRDFYVLQEAVGLRDWKRPFLMQGLFKSNRNQASAILVQVPEKTQTVSAFVT